MVVQIVFCLFHELIPFQFPWHFTAKHVHKSVIVHLLKHAIRAHIEYVSGLDVGDMHNVCLRPFILIGHYGTCNYVLATVRCHFLLTYLTCQV